MVATIGATPTLDVHESYGLAPAEAAAIARALAEGVHLAPGPDGLPCLYEAWRPGSPGRYVVSVDRCACPAGAHGRQCKHRSLLLLVRAILDGRPRGP